MKIDFHYLIFGAAACGMVVYNIIKLSKAASLSHAEIAWACDGAIKEAVLSKYDTVDAALLSKMIDERNQPGIFSSQRDKQDAGEDKVELNYRQQGGFSLGYYSLNEVEDRVYDAALPSGKIQINKAVC